MVNTLESYSSNYQLYMEQIIRQQKDMNRYIQECICLEEGNYEGLEFLNEGVLDSIKETIEKIIAKIKEFFAKLKESLDKTFKSEQKYLEEHKDIILQKQVTIDFNDYFNYDVKLFTEKSSIPKFAYEEMHNANALESEDAFISKYIPSFDGKGSKSFYDHAVYLLQGKEAQGTKEGKDINMKDLYNFCYDYDKIVSGIETEQKSLMNAQAEAYKIISNKSMEVAKPGETPNSDDTSEVETNTQTQESMMIYSSVYGSFITESFIHEITTAGKGNSSSNTNTMSAAPTKPGDAESISKNQKVSTGRQDKDLSKSMNGTEVETLKKEINVYFTVCSSMLNAKIYIAQKMHDEYMFVIREHIRSIVGTKDAKSPNKAIDAPTTYAKRLNDDVLSKLNQSEMDEYNTLYNNFNNEWVKFWQKNKQGTQYYRTAKGGQWIKVTDANTDLAKATKAFNEDAESKNTLEELKKFLKDKDIEPNVQTSQDTATINNNDRAPKK